MKIQKIVKIKNFYFPYETSATLNKQLTEQLNFYKNPKNAKLLFLL
jgi:hypothetical protein